VAATALTRLRWQAAHRARAIGPAGQLGIGILAVSALVVLFVLRPMHAEHSRVEASVREAARTRSSAEPPRRTSAAEQLAVFEQGFVADAGIPAAVGRLLEIASRHRMRIEQAEFKLASEAGQPLQRYAMAMPVRGDYRAVRRFVQEALRTQPGLALEELSLRRTDPRAPVVEAQLRFVLFVRKPERDAAPSAALWPKPAESGTERTLRERPVAMR